MDIIGLFWVLGYILILLGGFYRFFVSDFDYFLNQAISGPTPVPVFGNWWNQWNKKLPEVQLKRYKKYGRIFGIFEGRTPNLVVGDPKLLRSILIKDFDNFVNRVPTMDTKNKYANSMLLSLNNFKWKDTRNTLTPAFSSEKIKQMSGMVSDCVDTLINHLIEKSDNRFRKLDLRSIMIAFALDVTSICGFGTKIDSLANPNDPFVRNATGLFDNERLCTNPVVLLFALYPVLGKLIPRSIFKQINFFAKSARVTLEQRRKSAELAEVYIRNDFIDFMLESSADSSIVLNPLRNDIVMSAQILQFFFTGTDTTSNVLMYLLYSLALHEEIQDTLRAEILEAMKEDGIKIETIMELPYLQQCISETLRLYPPVIEIDRQCNKTTNYGGITVEKGNIVTVPVYSIHQDPEFYPNPQTFDPERFCQDKIKKRDPMTYLPFGGGPRACIGSQFAVQEIKIVVCNLLSQFRFKRTLETPEFLEFIPGIVPFYQTKKILVGFDRINSNTVPEKCGLK